MSFNAGPTLANIRPAPRVLLAISYNNRVTGRTNNYCINGLAIWHGLPDIKHFKVSYMADNQPF